MDIIFLQKFNKLKLIGFNLSFNDNRSFKFLYIGLKEYYIFNNLMLSFKTDLKKNLIILRRDLYKKKITSILYTNYCYPLFSIKSRFILFFKNKKNNFLFLRIEKFIKKLNKYKCFNYLFEILKYKKIKYLFNCFVKQIGNYSSGVKLSCYGIGHYFLYFKKQLSNKLTFISKKNYNELNFKLYRLKLNYFIKNFLIYFKLFTESFIYKKILLNNQFISYYFIYFYKEILKLKRFFRFYFIFIFTIVPPPKGKKVRIKKIINYYFLLYKIILKKIYKNLFYYLCKYNVNIIIKLCFLNFKNINLLVKNFIYIKFKNFNIDKLKLYIVPIYEIEKVYISRLKSYKNIYEELTAKNSYIRYQKIKKKIYKKKLKNNYVIRDIVKNLSKTSSNFMILKKNNFYKYYFYKNLYYSYCKKEKYV